MRDREPLIGNTQDAIEMTRHLTGVYREMTSEFLQVPRWQQPLLVEEMTAIARFERRLVNQFFIKKANEDEQEGSDK